MAKGITDDITACEGINTPSVKRSGKQRVKWQGPIGMHCDVPKSVPDPLPNVMASGALHNGNNRDLI